VTRFLWVAVAAILPACAGPVLQPLQWEPWTSYQAVHPATLVGTDPASLLAGDPAPWDGVLLRAADLQALLDERDRLVEALGLCNEGRGIDRIYADEALATCQEAVRVCRADGPRKFVVGTLVGAGGCAATAVGVAAAAAP